MQARQQAASHELEAAKLQLNADAAAERRRYDEASESFMHAATSGTSALHESAVALADSQAQVARATAEAVKQMAEVNIEALMQIIHNLSLIHI